MAKFAKIGAATTLVPLVGLGGGVLGKKVKQQERATHAWVGSETKPSGFTEAGQNSMKVGGLVWTGPENGFVGYDSGDSWDVCTLSHDDMRQRYCDDLRPHAKQCVQVALRNCWADTNICKSAWGAKNCEVFKPSLVNSVVKKP
ncbi:unnamed protein product [Amoebophrya sp. A120]|nr:unnamed protein product [Amoebophrya sp. A120]|eukprot:GSA120T00014125001.1